MYSRSLVLTVCLLLCLATAFGCKRKPEDLEPWRNAKGGVEKLEGWALSEEETLDVRVRALQILVEDGHLNRLPLTLDRIDEGQRATLVAALVPTVETLWAKQDMPRMTDALKQEGGEVVVGKSDSIIAKDAAYLLHPYVEGAERARLETILSAWVAEDHELRNQVGNATIGQILPRAGKDGMKGALVWLRETTRPGTVARSIREHADEAILGEVATVLRERAEAAHPDLDTELEIAVLETEHDNMVPYLQRVIEDPQASNEAIDGALTTLVKIQGERAASFLTRIVTERDGLLRWVAANRIIELRGKAGLLNIAMALPLEPASYAVPRPDSFKSDVQQICNLFATEMHKRNDTSYADVLQRALENNRWPAQVVALKCAEASRANDVIEAVAALRSSRQAIPAWGEARTVGQLAGEVHEALLVAANAPKQ